MTSPVISLIRTVGILTMIATSACAWAQSQATIALRGVVPAHLSTEVEHSRILISSNSPMIVTVIAEKTRGRSPASLPSTPPSNPKSARFLQAHESMEIPLVQSKYTDRHRICMTAP